MTKSIYVWKFDVGLIFYISSPKIFISNNISDDRYEFPGLNSVGL